MAPSLPRPDQRSPRFDSPQVLPHQDFIRALHSAASAPTDVSVVPPPQTLQYENSFQDLRLVGGHSDVNGFPSAPQVSTSDRLDDYSSVWRPLPMLRQIMGYPRQGDYDFQESYGDEPYWIGEDESAAIWNETTEGGEDVWAYAPQERDGGLSEETILKHLKTRKCTEEVEGDDEDDEMCVVCQDNLHQENCSIGMLRCGHEYHVCCIAKWLHRNNTCPLCKAVALLPVDDDRPQNPE